MGMGLCLTVVNDMIFWRGDRRGCTAPHSVTERMLNDFRRQTDFPGVREELPLLGSEGEGADPFPSQPVRLITIFMYVLMIFLVSIPLSLLFPPSLHPVFTKAKTIQGNFQPQLTSLGNQVHVSIPPYQVTSVFGETTVKCRAYSLL